MVEAYKEMMIQIEGQKHIKVSRKSSKLNHSSRSEASLQKNNSNISMRYQQQQTKTTHGRKVVPASPLHNKGMHSYSHGSPKQRPIVFEFDFYINAALLIQKCFRGYLSRKRVCNYYKFKAAVMVLESHLVSFLRKKMQEKRVLVKQLQVLSYNIQNQCKSVSKLRDQVKIQVDQKKNIKLLQTLTSTNQILVDSLLLLLVPDYSNKSQASKNTLLQNILHCIDGTDLQQNSQQQQEINSLRQEIQIRTFKHKEDIQKLRYKYQVLKQTHKNYLQKFIEQMKDVNQVNISSISRATHSSKSSMLSENNMNISNLQRQTQVTQKQYQQILSNPQVFKKK